jgi:hypothetical protein
MRDIHTIYDPNYPTQPWSAYGRLYEHSQYTRGIGATMRQAIADLANNIAMQNSLKYRLTFPWHVL